MMITSSSRRMASNQKAFLDMITSSKGTSTSPATKNNGYDVIITGIDGNPEISADYSKHPLASGRTFKVVNSRGLTSNVPGERVFLASPSDDGGLLELCESLRTIDSSAPRRANSVKMRTSFSACVRPERSGDGGFCTMTSMVNWFSIVYNFFIATTY